MTTSRREDIANALFNLLKGSAGYKSASRRLKMPEQLSGILKPALFQVEHKEIHTKGKLATPTYRTLMIDVWIYISLGQDPNEVPITILNNLIDAIDPNSGGVLKPDIHGRQTLGGIVADCYIAGEVIKVPGDIGNGLGAAVIPIEVVYM